MIAEVVDFALHFTARCARFAIAHRDLFDAITIVECSIFAIVIFFLWAAFLRQERWPIFITIAFAAFALIYVNRVLKGSKADALAEGWAPVLSALTSVMILAAARAILQYPQPFPWWGILIAILGAAASIEQGRFLLGPYYALLDASFSAFCLVFFSDAIYRGASARPPRLLAVPSALCGLGYALAALAAGATPLVRVGQWSELLLRTTSSPYDPIILASRLDSLLIATASVFKLFIFFGALVVSTRAILVGLPRTTMRKMRRLLNERLEYPSTQGMVEPIRDGLGADYVEVHLLVPARGARKVRRWGTPIERGENPFDRRWDVPDAATSVAGWVMCENRVFKTVDLPGTGKRDSSLEASRIRSVISVPILHGGALVGCVTTGWRRTYAISTTAVRSVQEIAIFVAPALQARRRLGCLYDLSTELGRLPSFDSVVKEHDTFAAATEAVHELVSPLATELEWNVGFKAITCIRCADGPTTVAFNSQPDAEEAQIRRVTVAAWANPIEVTRSPLVTWIRSGGGPDGAELPLGTLRYSLRGGRDDLDRPSLGCYPLHVSTIAAQVAEQLINATQSRLMRILTRLHNSLNSIEPKIADDGWFKAVKDAIEEAGLQWVVVTQPSSSELLGDADHCAVVRSLASKAGRAFGNPVRGRLFQLDCPLGRTTAVLELLLPPTPEKLWLGVERGGFGRELDTHTPWFIFLSELAQTVGSALAHFTAAIDLQRMQLESAQQQSVISIAATAGALTHQLKNLAKDLSMGSQTLLEAFEAKDVRIATSHAAQLPALVTAMKGSADRMVDLALGILAVKALDDRRPCDLAEVVEAVRKLYRPAAFVKRASIDATVDAGLLIDLPFHIATLALANLVDNALHAIDSNGAITIAAGRDNDTVRCTVADNGPGIPTSIREKLFRPGVTTKPASGGWGLYLVHVSLRQYDADIHLMADVGEGTTFVLDFPSVSGERTDNGRT